VENVENLSTAVVDKSPFAYLLCANVENLSTAIVDKSLRLSVATLKVTADMMLIITMKALPL
jgi:hypothetical protein